MKPLPTLAIADHSNRIIRNTFNASVVSFIVSSLISAVGSLIDGVVIGQFLGLDSMAAFGLVSPVVILFTLVGNVIAAGSCNRFTVKISIRDDCGIFDPVKQLQLYDVSRPMYHMGLRLAIGSAKDVRYTTMLKLNNLVLRV